MIKNSILLINTLAILFIFNLGIYQNETILKSNDIVMLEIRPVQEKPKTTKNYLRLPLHYLIEKQMNGSKPLPALGNGLAVITLNEKKVAQFVRFYHNESLSPQEKLIRFHYSPSSSPHFKIKPDHLFLKKSLLPSYQTANYAIFKYKGNKRYLFIGLSQ